MRLPMAADGPGSQFGELNVRETLVTGGTETEVEKRQRDSGGRAEREVKGRQDQTKTNGPDPHQQDSAGQGYPSTRIFRF